MDTEMTLSDYKKAHEEILKAIEENRQSFEFAILCHDQNIFTDKTRENVSKASVLAWVVERFKKYENDEDVKAENV